MEALLVEALNDLEVLKRAPIPHMNARILANLGGRDCRLILRKRHADHRLSVLCIDPLHLLFLIIEDDEAGCEVDELVVGLHDFLLVMAERTQLITHFNRTAILEPPLHIFTPEPINPL